MRTTILPILKVLPVVWQGPCDWPERADPPFIRAFQDQARLRRLQRASSDDTELRQEPDPY